MSWRQARQCDDVVECSHRHLSKFESWDNISTGNKHRSLRISEMYTRTMGINIHFHSNETTTLTLFQCQIRISINRVTIYTFGIFRHTVSMNHTQFIWRSLHSTQIWLKSGVCFVLPTTAISALPTTKGLLTFTMYEKIFPVKQARGLGRPLMSDWGEQNLGALLDYIKVGTVFLFGLFASPLLLFSDQTLAWKRETRSVKVNPAMRRNVALVSQTCEAWVWDQGNIWNKTSEVSMAHTRVRKFVLLQLITSLCRITMGELTVVRPQKALMIPQGDFNQISNHKFDNNIARIVRYMKLVRLCFVLR